MTTSWLGRSFLRLDEIDSTNSYLKREAFSLAHGTAVTAAVQTAGKGRLGRGWSAEPGACLALSYLLRDWRQDRLTALPLVVGLGVSRAVEAVAGVPAPIKWSNDVLLGERKLCGILCESRLREGSFSVVAGQGINLLQTREEFDGLSLVYATSLRLETGKSVDSEFLAAKILNESEPLLERFLAEGFSALREEYARRCINLGRDVLLLAEGREPVEGKALDISDDGDLICSVGGRITHVRAGEVSVRGLMGYV